MTDDGTVHPERGLLPSRYHQIDLGGDPLIATFRPDEGMGVPVRDVCARLGLDLAYTSQQLRGHPVLRQGLRRDRVPIGGRMQEVVVILHKYIPFWLATISPDLVAAEMQGLLIRYQTELVDVLAAVYLAQQGTPATPEQRQIALLGEQMRQVLAQLRVQEERFEGIETLLSELSSHIPVTPAQAAHIQKTIKELGARVKREQGRDVFAMLQAQFCAAMGTPRYDALPAAQYEQALSWLAEQARALFGDDAAPPAQERLL